jgi:hypothetical protein
MSNISNPINPAVLAIASVEDAHNQGALVRVLGETQRTRALYDAVLQSSGVVIRACHLVVVDRSRDPWEIIWRIGTRGIVCAIGGQMLTLDLGYRVLTIPLQDERPDRDSRPLAVSDEVLLRGHLEQAIVSDVFIDGEPAHPERLQTLLDEVVARKS